jgi:hypothetical protein
LSDVCYCKSLKKRKIPGSGKYEKVLLLKLKNVTVPNMTKFRVHKKVLFKI